MNVDVEQITDTWRLFTLTNDHGMCVRVLNYGGIIVGMDVPDKNGMIENVVLGYENVTDYADNPTFFGAIVGRVAGRIQDASFSIGEDTYRLEANEGPHHLHGGAAGFHQVVWEDEPFQSDDAVGVKLTHTSVEAKLSYPGNVTVSVTYTLTNDNQLMLDYSGTTDKKTPLAMTNHTYFNLSGNQKDTIHQHELTIPSNHFLSLDNTLIPTGNIESVDNSVFDFRRGRKLADGIEKGSKQNKTVGNGYDHYFLLRENEDSQMTLTEEKSGRILRITTDLPGVVLYTANGLPEGLSLSHGDSKKYGGVCLEAQGHPAALNNSRLPSIILHPDEAYRKRIMWEFDVSGS